jgi:hypothetical protein
VEQVVVQPAVFVELLHEHGEGLYEVLREGLIRLD